MKLLKSFIKVFISTRPNIVYCFDSSWNLIMWTGDNLSIIKVHKAVSLKNDISWRNYSSSLFKWRRGVVVITTAQLHSTKPELRFCAGSNPARRVGDSWWWGSLTMIPAGNKAKRLSSVNHTTKTIHHHHHHHHHDHHHH